MERLMLPDYRHSTGSASLQGWFFTVDTFGLWSSVVTKLHSAFTFALVKMAQSCHYFMEHLLMISAWERVLGLLSWFKFKGPPAHNCMQHHLHVCVYMYTSHSQFCETYQELCGFLFFISVLVCPRPASYSTYYQCYKMLQAGKTLSQGMFIDDIT